MAVVSDAAKVQAIAPTVDPKIVAARDMLLGLAGSGFVDVIVVGIKPRNEGFTVACTAGMDVVRVIGHLAIAQADAVRMLQQANGGSR